MKRFYVNPLTAFKTLRYLIVLSVVVSVIHPVAALSSADFSSVPVDFICKLYNAFITIAAALGGLIIVVAGVSWIAAHDDPGKRKAAKDAIIHTVIGLIIVSLAATIIGGVTLRYSDNTQATFATVCITT